MNTPSWSVRCRLALVSVCSLLAAAPPALAEARVIFKSERSLVLRVRDLNGDRVRDLAYFFPDQRTQFDGPGRAEIQTQDGIILAQFRASGQHEVFALGANHPADLDDNQILNSDDLTLLVQRAGRTGAPGAPGDVNFDGVVNDADASRLMTSLTNLGGLGWVRFEHRWPAAFAPHPDERGVCDFFEETPEFVFCRNPGGGNDPDQSDPDDTGPLGPGSQGGGGGPDGPDDPGPGDDECAGVSVDLNPGATTSFVSVVDNRPTPLTISAGGSPAGGAATWSVAGAVVIQSDDHRCDVEVHEAGLVVVTATYVAPNGCTAEATLELPAYALDLSVDIDENGAIDDADIDAEALAPGLILLANNFDEDGDGVEGFADGFDWNPLIEQDDSDDTTTFIPIKLSVGGVESGNARIRIDYPASDPMALSIGEEGWELPPGNLRLWKADGSEPRSAELLIDGGDYIAPGEYTLADLGLFGSSEATLYVETVRESQAEGDIVIAAAVSADEESGWVASDVVVGTGVRVETEVQFFNLDQWLPTFGVTTTDLHPPLELPPGKYSYGAWSIYRFVIFDPRPGVTHISCENLVLPLQREGVRHESDAFFVVNADMPEDAQGHPTSNMIVVTGSEPYLGWEYQPVVDGNARASAAKRGRQQYLLVIKPTASQKKLEHIISDIVAEMRAEGWTAPDNDDDGAYGKEVHRRAFNRVSGGGTGWYGSVWVDPSTGQVVRMGNIGAIPAGSREVDVIKMKRGHSIAVGQVLNRDHVDFACEIKTSASGSMSWSQASFYDNMFGANKWGKLIPSHMWDAETKMFVTHTRAGVHRALKAVGVVGLTAGAAFTIHDLSVYQLETQICTLFSQLDSASSETARFEVAVNLQLALMDLTAAMGLSATPKAIADMAGLTVIFDRFGYDGPPKEIIFP